MLAGDSEQVGFPSLHHLSLWRAQVCASVPGEMSGEVVVARGLGWDTCVMLSRNTAVCRRRREVMDI